VSKRHGSHRRYDQNCPRCARTVAVEVSRLDELGDRYLRRAVSARRLFIPMECDCKLDRDEWREIAEKALNRYEDEP
jgi:hypothetical protein